MSETWGPEKQAVMAALAEAGYVIVPREPTEAMCWAGASFTGISPGMASAAWRAMVDEALK